MKSCKKTGASKGAISQWRNDLAKPSGERLVKLASVLMVSPDWLVTGKGHLEPHANAEMGPRLRGKVPVISEVQAGAWTEIKNRIDENSVKDWVQTTQAVSDYAFALRVTGDSMVNPSERRSLAEGMIVVVDPEKEAKHRDIVVARLSGSDKATIKELVLDGDTCYLRPFNTQFPIIPVTNDVVIVGRVMSAHIDM